MTILQRLYNAVSSGFPFVKLGICKRAVRDLHCPPCQNLCMPEQDPQVALYKQSTVLVMNLSDARLPQPFEINDTVPCRGVCTRIVSGHMQAKREGLSIKTPKQSIMIANEENFCPKQAGNVIFMSFLALSLNISLEMP